MLTVTFFFGQFVLFRAQNQGKITPSSTPPENHLIFHPNSLIPCWFTTNHPLVYPSYDAAAVILNCRIFRAFAGCRVTNW